MTIKLIFEEEEVFCPLKLGVLLMALLAALQILELLLICRRTRLAWCKVKILSVDDKGKIALSVKQAQEKKPEERPQQREQRSFNARPQRESGAPMRHEGFRASGGDFRRSNSRFGGGSNASFEDKLSRFLKDSDERLTDLSRKTDSKRGGRGGGRRR